MDPDQINELSQSGQVPLAFRMTEHLPGMTSSFLFAQHRASNTIMRGGFMDDRSTFGGRRAGTGKLGGFAKGSKTLTQPTSSAYYGSSARRARLGAVAGTPQGKMALGRGFRQSHITARPSALNRYASLSIFNASENAATYSPFQMAAKLGGSQAKKSKAFRDAFYGGREIGKEEQVFQRGMVSMVTAGRKADILERKAIARGPQSRAAARLGKAQTQVTRLASMNNPALLQSGSFVNQAAALRTVRVGMPGASPVQRLATARAAGQQSIMATSPAILAGGTKVGLTGNLMASAGSTAGSRGMLGYARGALGQVGAGGLTGEALTGANRAISNLSTALGGNKTRVATKALEQGVFKTLGIKRTLAAAGTKQGAAVLGMRTAAMAIPGLNLLATASLVYDLGKMGGELVKSGATLAKDAVKSMKGSIDKPLFGMGYKDNEVAATSRSRGVMAIQNSRLNARSMLGSEAGMMAAHFG